MAAFQELLDLFGSKEEGLSRQELALLQSELIQACLEKRWLLTARKRAPLSATSRLDRKLARLQLLVYRNLVQILRG